jgi:hypothetical protein
VTRFLLIVITSIIVGIAVAALEQCRAQGAINQGEGMSESLTLAEAYPKEQARVREVLELYKAIPTGGFAAVWIADLLRRAEKAAAENDTAGMVACFYKMKGVKE